MKIQVSKFYLLKNNKVARIIEYVHLYKDVGLFKTSLKYIDTETPDFHIVFLNEDGIPNYRSTLEYTAIKEITKEKNPEYFL